MNEKNYNFLSSSFPVNESSTLTLKKKLTLRKGEVSFCYRLKTIVLFSCLIYSLPFIHRWIQGLGSNVGVYD